MKDAARYGGRRRRRVGSWRDARFNADARPRSATGRGEVHMALRANDGGCLRDWRCRRALRRTR